MKARIGKGLLLIAISVFGIAFIKNDVFRECVTDERFIVAMIGLVPIGLLYFVIVLKLRFGLNDLSAAILGFGAVLVPLHYLLEHAGYSIREYPAIVLYVEVTIGAGFVSAMKNRARLHERFVALRWIVFLSTLMAPATMIPAFIITVALVISDSPFRNDMVSGIAYLALVVPVLVAFWFWGIKEVRKGDELVP